MDKKLIILVCLVLISSLTVTGALAQNLEPPDTNGEGLADHVPGEVLIRFNPWINSTQAALQMEQLDLKLKREIPVLDVKLVKLPPGLSVEEAISRFSQRPGVEFVEPNYILQIAAVNQEEITDQWGLQKIEATQAWSTFGEGQPKVPITLATVDSGIDPTHNDLSANMWSNSGEIPDNGLDDDDNGYIDDTWGWDFVNNDNDPFDDNLHGTAVSSVMAGDLDGDGVAGVCPWCQVMAVKVMTAGGTGTLDVVANGIVYAANAGARVINLSLAGIAGAQTLQDAVDYAWAQGALVVAGAGNDGANAPMYPAGYANAMAIGSTGETDTHSCFSNYGEDYISVVAPGENILIAIPDQGYAYGSGTSLSTPYVAGLGGLLFSQDSGRTNSEVRSLIESTAVDLSPPGVDATFGYGRINAYRAVTGDQSQVTPPDGLFSTDNTATGYAHARKLVRDSSGILHMIWHTKEGTDYRIRYATSINDGDSWNLEPDVFKSQLETYHPAIATDGQNLFVAIPSRSGVDQPYQILFTRKALPDGEWLEPVSLMGGTYDAVRPDIYYDPINEKLHLVASSFDNAPYVYYQSSEDQGASWNSSVAEINPSTGTDGANSNTRYATIHANGNNIYIVSRTFSSVFFTYYYMHSVRSTDGGQTWFDQFKISSYTAFFTGEYGISLAGVGDRVYMGYEVGSNMYFRIHDGISWSDYETLELGDSSNVHKWPTITQAEDGQAWLIFEVNSELFMRHYDGSTWAPKESIGTGNYANLKLGINGDKLEWVTTQCNGAPFLVSYDSRNLGVNPPNLPPTADFTYTTSDLTATFTDASTDNDGTITSWVWDFGDTNSSTMQNPEHTYTAADTYTVSLTVTDDDGDSDIVSQIVTVTEPANVSPTASFSFGTSDLTATFTDTSTDSDGTIASWLWNFGDGNSSTMQNPEHTYTAADTYTVSLTVTDDDGDSDIVSQIVTVTEPANVSPTASFTHITAYLTATFTDTSTDNDGTIASWAWDFGDTNGSIAQNPVHSYAAAGTYTVSLTVMDDDGDSGSVGHSVTVSEPPLPPQEYIQVVDGEISASGTISGSYLDTQTDDGITQTITEDHSGGKPNQRISFFEHIWTIEVHPGEVVTFSANAWAPVSSDGDAFQFQYSLDDSTYTNMFTIANNSDSGVYQFYTLPINAIGKVYIRFIDTDRTPGNRTLDIAYIDHLFISSQTAEGYLPAKPHDLTAIPVSSNQINLSWIDNTDDALGYQVERSTDGSNWQVIGTVIADSTSFNDTGLEPDSTYIYRIRAYNATGYSGYSNTDSATTNQASTMHVGDIDGSTSLGKRGRWNATAVVTIHSEDETMVEGATVTGTWSNGRVMSCTTDVSGSCSITLSNIKSEVESISFTVTSVTAPGWEYNSNSNHDDDGTSNGTSITIEP